MTAAACEYEKVSKVTHSSPLSGFPNQYSPVFEGFQLEFDGFLTRRLIILQC